MTRMDAMGSQNRLRLHSLNFSDDISGRKPRHPTGKHRNKTISHHDLALSVVSLTEDPEAKDDAGLAARLAETFGPIVTYRDESFTTPENGGGLGANGFGYLKFHEKKFYSVKMANLNRDRLGASSMIGAGVLGGMSLQTAISGLLATGTLAAWPGLGVIAAMGLIAMGRLKPMLDGLTFDDATALALAWEHSTRNHGFQLVEVSAILANLEEAERVYSNHGFSEAKLRNALGTLKAKGLVAEVTTDRYQLVEDIKVSDGRKVTLFKA